MGRNTKRRRPRSIGRAQRTRQRSSTAQQAVHEDYDDQFFGDDGFAAGGGGASGSAAAPATPRPFDSDPFLRYVQQIGVADFFSEFAAALPYAPRLHGRSSSQVFLMPTVLPDGSASKQPSGKTFVWCLATKFKKEDGGAAAGGDGDDAALDDDLSEHFVAVCQCCADSVEEARSVADEYPDITAREFDDRRRQQGLPCAHIAAALDPRVLELMNDARREANAGVRRRRQQRDHELECHNHDDGVQNEIEEFDEFDDEAEGKWAGIVQPIKIPIPHSNPPRAIAYNVVYADPDIYGELGTFALVINGANTATGKNKCLGGCYGFCEHRVIDRKYSEYIGILDDLQARLRRRYGGIEDDDTLLAKADEEDDAADANNAADTIPSPFLPTQGHCFQDKKAQLRLRRIFSDRATKGYPSVGKTWTSWQKGNDEDREMFTSADVQVEDRHEDDPSVYPICFTSRIEPGHGWCHRCKMIRAVEAQPTQQGFIFTEGTRHNIDVIDHRCKECATLLPYDGFCDGLVRLAPRRQVQRAVVTAPVFFDLEMLYTFVNSRTKSGKPMLEHYGECLDRYSNRQATEGDRDPPIFEYRAWCKIVGEFESCLDIDFVKSFTCKHCKEKPRIIIIDGITLGMQRNRCREAYMKRRLQKLHAEKYTPFVKTATNRVKGRVMVPTQSCRARILELSGGKRRKPGAARNISTLSRFKGISGTNYANLKADPNVAWLHPLLTFLETKMGLRWPQGREGELKLVPEAFRRVLSDIGVDTPASALCHPDRDLLTLLERTFEEGVTKKRIYDLILSNADTQSWVRSSSRTAYQIVSLVKCGLLNDTNGGIEAVAPIMRHLIGQVRDTYFRDELRAHESAVLQRCAIDPVVVGAYRHDMRDGEWFPHHPPVRKPLTYDKNDQTPSCRLSGCEKCPRPGDSYTLSPGVFTIHCQHGVCYGFQLMVTPEGPSTAYDLIFRRFQEAPDVVIYDNACNLHRMTLNRVGTFFEKTKFVVDPFHKRNHITCSDGYSLDNLGSRQAVDSVSRIRSPSAEFGNSWLRKLEGSVTSMGQARFMRTVRYHFHRLNCHIHDNWE